MSVEDLLQHKLKFDQFLAKTPRPLSCYHFSSIFAWQDFFTFSFEVIEGALCVFAHQGKDSFLYLPPLGQDICLPTVEGVFERMGKSKIARIENISDNQLPLLHKIAFLRGQCEHAPQHL